MPISIVQGLASPLLGEAVDRYKEPRLLAMGLLFISASGTFVSVLLLVTAASPGLALLYAFVRGISGCVFFTLINSGTLYMMLGVQRSQIGRVLGKSTLATIAGTGIGPLIYGLGKDVLGNFWVPVSLTSVPHLLYGLFFGAQALSSCCSRKALIGFYASVGSKGGLEGEDQEPPCCSSRLPSPSSDVLGSPTASYHEEKEQVEPRRGAV